MALNLAKIIERGYRERENQERERNEPQSTQHLIPSSQNSVNNQETHTNDPEVGILQPYQENDTNRTPFPLNYVTQSYESITQNTENAELAAEGDKINFTAAALVLVLYVMSISLIVYGCTHLNDCPAQKMIPISYVVLGSLMLFSRILSLPEECRKIFKRERDVEIIPQILCRVCLNFLVQIATMCMFFALCYWIFHTHPDTKEGSPNYCEKELYKNSYYGCIVALSLTGIMLFLMCCAICVSACALMSRIDDP